MKMGDDKVPQPGELFQMAPMVDIVFTLLSFFVMATHLRAYEQDFSVGYQQTALAAGAEAQDFPSAVPVRLRCRPGGSVSISVGHTLLHDDDFAALQATLTQINMPAMSVTIMADPGLTVDQVARAIDAVVASPMKNVSVSRLGTTNGPPPTTAPGPS